MEQLWIPYQLPTLNELLDLRALQGASKGSKYRRSPYAAVKRVWGERVKEAVGSAGTPSFDGAYVTLIAVERSRRRDPDNVISGGLKVILDGLVSARVLPNDGWLHVCGLKGHWVLKRHRKPGSLVLLSSERCVDSLSDAESMVNELLREMS